MRCTLYSCHNLLLHIICRALGAGRSITVSCYAYCARVVCDRQQQEAAVSASYALHIVRAPLDIDALGAVQHLIYVMRCPYNVQRIRRRAHDFLLLPSQMF